MTICTNSVRVPHVIMDRAVLTSLSEAFDARMIEEAIEQGWRSSGPARDETGDHRATLERDLATIEQIGHLDDALKRGRATD